MRENESERCSDNEYRICIAIFFDSDELFFFEENKRKMGKHTQQTYISREGGRQGVRVRERES